ncbi:Phosphoenolpyruvate-protein phosphotransferase [Sebaldella termitidis]|jgi:phosphotransferase system enzyme I (PtsI)|uniref:Phosphoenolpyruvate-protein phosphotransferase n=1 Tax=Sebaldella termitidis (strain ATCC 33386 / NCTC 11300) TaxID=526218 RepID=D1AG83_SEBTE|nr:phosphoenolpyruvate--protein phosphotransferase [Sebaldella termitidis]ACZ10709.1 phosphoenolpyruvate-protein phosphotransferase [Sebaldella termitidis ATCC 33386]SUI26050.1 Phosphoenolpyruvate-protein phosphotransferase [Sebaldella termitidis]
MKEFKGIGASEGISIGKVMLFIEEEMNIPQEKISEVQVGTEIEKLLDAQKKSKLQLISIRDKVKEKMGEDKAAIFDGHIMLLEDDDLMDEVKDKIKAEKMAASRALDEGVNEYCEMISQLDDPYLREREADLKDVGKRWLKNILGIRMKDLSNLDPETVVVAYDLTPSDTAQLDLKNAVGFITEIGGKTSHSAIMARSLELPAVVGVKDALKEMADGASIVMNGEVGEIIIEPDAEILKDYTEKREAYLKEKEELKKLIDEEAVTADGHKVELWGNIGSPEDIDAVLEAGATGVGLYRTEFLFMNSDHLPTEEEQYKAYRVVAEKLQGKPVTIRTMDIGGDKELPYMDLPKELNPFLGWRAIRISLVKQDIFKTQLRAILRASAYGQVKIMYPMVTSINEVRKANEILDECKRELDEIGKKYDKDIKVGIMVETPSVAIISYKFAKEVDFFSIGTNDLTQYFLAVDRGNELVASLYDSFNPAVLEAIQKVIDAGHDRNISVSMCGEFAGDRRATELLLGMGLDAFSMSASSVLQVKKKIRNSSYEKAQKYRDEILALNTPEEVLENLR